MEYDDKVSQLERTILELGSEIFRIKTEVFSLKTNQENFFEVMKGLKMILDEKGVISSDDFDGAVDLGNAVNIQPSSLDLQVEEDIEKIKKTTH